MKKLPQIILDEWKNRTGAPVMTTVDGEGNANSIYATCVAIYRDSTILVANNYFNKTLMNIEKGCRGNFLFITEDKKAYQLKGTYAHYTSGEEFEDMKKWNPERHPGVGVAVLTVEEIYSGAQRIEFR